MVTTWRLLGCLLSPGPDCVDVYTHLDGCAYVWEKNEKCVSNENDMHDFVLTRLYLPLSLRSVSMPPRLTNEIFHSNNRTFFIGKCGAVPPQKRVIIFNSFTESSSSPIGASVNVIGHEFSAN